MKVLTLLCLFLFLESFEALLSSDDETSSALASFNLAKSGKLLRIYLRYSGSHTLGQQGWGGKAHLTSVGWGRMSRRGQLVEVKSQTVLQQGGVGSRIKRFWAFGMRQSTLNIITTANMFFFPSRFSNSGYHQVSKTSHK